MIRRIIAILLAWSCGLTALLAANVVTVKGASGDVGTQVEISVELTTDANDVVAAEIRIPMPSYVTPVEGSCLKVDSRLPSHTVTGDLNGNEYVIVIFNSNLATIPAGSGKALSFKLNLGENPVISDLKPRVKFSDALGKTLQASASGETLTILGAKLELSETDIDFGRVPIRGKYTKTVTATNTGTSNLNLTEFTTDVPGLTVTSDSQSLPPNGSSKLTLDYQPTERSASIAGRFTAVSNSVGRAPFVRVTSVPFSVNELHVGSAEGISDSEQIISVAMNNMEPIVGAEVSFQLPEGLEYVDGSLEAAARATGFTASANYGADRNLRLVLFNLNNTAATGDDGELMTFKLKLAGRSGSYVLTPLNVILSNSASENMVSATSAGSVTIQSPSMQASSTMDIGNVPLSGENTFDYPVYNGSSVPLTLENVLFLDDVAECKAEFPIIIEANSKGKIPVTIKNPRFGEFTSTMNVYSNDPDNRMKVVCISGNFYIPNELTVNHTIENGRYVLTAELTNEAEIVAMQLDIIMPEGASELSDSDLTLLSRAQSHSTTLAKVADNKYRIIIFSLTNAPFTGNSGGIFTINFTGSDLEGNQVRIENVKLSGKDGVNYTSPTTVAAIFADPNARVDVYNMNGILLKRACTSDGLKQLTPGMYILRSGNKVVKTLIH